MNARTGWMRAVPILAVGAIGLAFTVQVSAQVQTNKEEQSGGAATRQVKVERAEVLSVYGNDLILKMEDGTIRHMANVSESARATVDGREVGIHELKPGMHLQKTITTTTTPKVIVTTQTVTGKVWHVTPPNSVILTMENGENQQFKIPKGQKFTVNGQETDAFGLKKGMMVSATKVVEEPMTQVQQEAKLSGHMPPPPPAPAADTPILVAVAVPAPAPAASAEPAAELPKTGSNLPLIGLLGLLLIAGSLVLRVSRKLRA
jgi:LPXTG-motif cell wall-anchored protein